MVRGDPGKDHDMQRWKYHSLLIRDLSICESKLNTEGDKGWELVNICLMDANTARAFFKMPSDGATEAGRLETETALVSHNPFG